MNASTKNLPLPLRPAPEPMDPELAPLLAAPLADAYASPAPAALRGRLAQRVARSLQAESPMHTRRRRQLQASHPAPGVTEQTLYQAAAGAALRPGEPLVARLVELQPGASYEPPPATQRDWLVLGGTVQLAGQELALRDYHVAPAGVAARAVAGAAGALLFVREAALPAVPGEPATTVRDAEAGWPEYAPGIRRRVLWQRDGQAAMLYHTEPGASVPHHGHGHDEECLMVQGELFLDDWLLQAGDYQLAPAGTGHQVTHTDTGVVLYAHGDLDLRFV